MKKSYLIRLIACVITAILLLSSLTACTVRQNIDNTPEPVVSPEQESTVEPANTPEVTVPPDEWYIAAAWETAKTLGEQYGIELNPEPSYSACRDYFASVNFTDENEIGFMIHIEADVSGTGFIQGSQHADLEQSALLAPIELVDAARESWDEEYEASLYNTPITVTQQDIEASGCTATDGSDYLDAVGECFAIKLAEAYKGAEEGFRWRCTEMELDKLERDPDKEGRYFFLFSVIPADIPGFIAAFDFNAFFTSDASYPDHYGWLQLAGYVELEQQDNGDWVGLTGFTK